MSVTRKQHLVSVTLLKRWAHSGKLHQVDLQTRRHGLSAPRHVAYAVDLAPPLQVSHSESVWSEVESRAGLALKDLSQGNEFDRIAIKDLVALHLARSYDMIDASHNHFKTYEPIGNLTQLSFEELDQHSLERSGLHIVGREGAQLEQRNVNNMIYQQFHETFATELPKILAEMQGLFRSLGLGIWTCETGEELLIGDTPSVTIDRTGTRTGLDSGVWPGSAANVFMPLDPSTLAIIGRTDEEGILPSSAIQEFNLIQCQRARRRVFCRPGSGLHEWTLAEHQKSLDAMK